VRQVPDVIGKIAQEPEQETLVLETEERVQPDGDR
jgi:hypothetical protein